jgi:hypothetical protein
MSDCPQCGRRHKAGDRFCRCGHDFWWAAGVDAGMSAPTRQRAIKARRRAAAGAAPLILVVCALVVFVLAVFGLIDRASGPTKRVADQSSHGVAVWPPTFAASVCAALDELQIHTGPAINDLTNAGAAAETGDLVDGANVINRSAQSAQQMLEGAAPWTPGTALLEAMATAAGLAEDGAEAVKLAAQRGDGSAVETGKRKLLRAAASLREATNTFVALHASTGLGC